LKDTPKLEEQQLIPLSYQTSWLALLALQITQTALWALPAADSTRASVPANVIMSIGVLALGLLSYAEHMRSVRPSFILNTYLFCSLLFDIARSRTLWLRSVDTFNDTIAIVTTVAVGVKLALFLLEAVEKRHILKPEYADYPPEATAGFYNRAVFWWLNPLFKIGFTGVLRVDDLSSLDKELSSERLLAQFEEKWSKGKYRSLLPGGLSLLTLYSFSDKQIAQYSSMGVSQSCQMASSCRSPRKSLRRGLQLLSAFASREITLLLQFACEQGN
jgi:hypothetical protein